MKYSNSCSETNRRPQSRCLSAVLMTIGFAFCQISLVMAAPPANIPASGNPKIGKGVSQEIAANGFANVVIALAEPKTPPGLVNMPKMKNEIALMQSAVLAGVDGDGYVGKYAFNSVPALAGALKSEKALNALANNPSVVKIDLDVGGEGHLASSVPLIGADLRHGLGNSGSGVVVAVLDSGLDTDNPDLADDLIAEACFADNDGSIDGVGRCPNGSDRQTGAGAAEDDAGHGTHVTGIITSNGTSGVVGVAPDADIVAIRVTYGPSFSGAFASFAEIIAALDYIIDNPGLGVQVINMSIGTNALFTGDCDAAAAWTIAGSTAINTLRANGVIAFASAGNNGSTTQMSAPACFSNVISVGSSDDSDVPAGTTNSNASTDIFAPGVNVDSSAIGGGTTNASGTSMASPTAAGCAALLIETAEATTPDDIETRLETSAFQVNVPGNGLSFPRIDCAPFANVPPVCDAGGPYVAECAATVGLDGTGSNDPDGGSLDFLWEGPIDGGSAVGPTPLVEFLAPTGAKNISLTVSDGEDDTQCSAPVTVEDTTMPSIILPADVIEECSAPDGTAVVLGTATATDSCDANPVVDNNAPALFPLGDTQVTWAATDADGNQASDIQLVTVVDTTPPEVTCNAPATITPPDAEISFTATATDQCQADVTPTITQYDCFKVNKKGKVIGKNASCLVSFAGDKLTISDVGGVSTFITWTAFATDASGNTGTEECSLQIANPGL